MRRTHWIGAAALLLVLGGACGDDDGEHHHADASASADASSADAANADAANNPADASLIDGNAGAFTLTSTAFTMGGAIPSKFTCDGMDVSPQLSWSNPPAGTMSFAFIFDDISFDFLHSTAWDIPLSRTSLDEAVPNTFEPFGAGDMKQSRSWRGPSVVGYSGPCPPGGPNTYRFTIHAIPTTTISGLTQTTGREAVRTAIKAASIGSVDLDGMYTRAP